LAAGPAGRAAISTIRGMTGIRRRDSIPIEGYTPRRRGDGARRVRWPGQGEAEVRSPRPRERWGPIISRQVSQVTTMWASAGVALHRRPPAGKPPTTAARKVTNQGHPRTAPAPAARSRPLACLGSIQYPWYRTYQTDPPAREQSVTEAHLRYEINRYRPNKVDFAITSTIDGIVSTVLMMEMPTFAERRGRQ
jgi:hypothetical protein